MERLYSYKMSHDDGFAPNPYFGVLTLATCMCKMRQNTKVGNWIAGWTSRKTATSTPPGEERLIYLAKVTDKIPIAEYWDRFPMKRPSNADEKSTHGDNIYCPDSSSPNGLRLVESVYRRPTDTVKIGKDLNGGFVLICEEYYFFGADSPLEVPQKVRPNVPKYQSSFGVITEAPTSFIAYVKANAGLCKECSNFRKL